MWIGRQTDHVRNGILHAFRCDTCSAEGRLFISEIDRIMGNPVNWNGWRTRNGRDECPACVAADCDRIADELLLVTN